MSLIETEAHSFHACYQNSLPFLESCNSFCLKTQMTNMDHLGVFLSLCFILGRGVERRKGTDGILADKHDSRC